MSGGRSVVLKLTQQEWKVIGVVTVGWSGDRERKN